jgi:hypothetical protein
VLVIEVGEGETREATYERVRQFAAKLTEELVGGVPWAEVWARCPGYSRSQQLFARLKGKIVVVGDNATIRKRMTKESAYLAEAGMECRHYGFDIIYVVGHRKNVDGRLMKCLQPVILSAEVT